MVAALANSAEESYKNILEHSEKVREVKKALWEGILSNIPNVSVNGDSIENANPYVLNVAFKDIRSEVLLHALEEKDIYVSAGSACDSRKKALSHVLSAMNVSPELIEGSIRFSFSRFNTVSEAEKCVAELCKVVPMLRRVQRMRR